MQRCHKHGKFMIRKAKFLKMNRLVRHFIAAELNKKKEQRIRVSGLGKQNRLSNKFKYLAKDRILAVRGCIQVSYRRAGKLDLIINKRGYCCVRTQKVKYLDFSGKLDAA